MMAHIIKREKMKLIAFKKTFHVMLSEAKNLGLSLRGAFFATKQSPTTSEIASSLLRLWQDRCPLKTLLAMTILVLLLAAACQSSNNNATTNAVWSGFLEGKSIDVSSEVGGRITQIAAQEGDTVKPGQPLVTLDDEFVRLHIDAADANVAAAQAQVALLEAGARPEDIQKAQARVDQANAAYLAASQAVTDTEAIRANPQTLLIAQADAQTRALAATSQLTATVKQAEAADLENQFWADQNKSMEEGNDIRLPNGTTLHFDTSSTRLSYARDQWSQAGNRAWQAWASVDSAKANATMASKNLQDLTDQLNNPIALDARVSQARAARDKAAANLAAAQAALQILRDGASAAQIQSARAALDQAQAARATLDKELARYQITAPSAGVVTRIAYRVGEIVAPNLSIVQLSVDQELKLRIFVSFGQLDKVQVGDTATLFVSESNNTKLTGTVTNIADRAEFTARQAQTDNERNAQLVAVEITVNDSNHQAKAGMPANVVFGPASQGIQITLPDLLKRDALTFSGSLEAKQTRIAAELGGRVVAVRADLGDAIKKGDALIDLDDASYKSSQIEADAMVRVAQSNLDQVNEPARPSTIALADAGIAQANADLLAATAALNSANQTLKSPQDILTLLHLAEGKVAAAQGDVARAQATVASIKSQVDIAANDQSYSGKTRLAILQKQKDAADASLLAAQATLIGNKRVLELDQQWVNNPLEILASQHSAANQVKTAQAGVVIAQTDLAIAKRGPQKEAVAVAEAKLHAAQANQKIVQAQSRRYAIASPLAGTVVARNTEPGETARAGAPLLTIADTRELEMTVYVPINNLDAVKMGQTVQLTSPTLSGKVFSGKVTYIAADAEFKPANIYNSKERSEMVFAVRVTVPNPNDELKAGLPADVKFR